LPLAVYLAESTNKPRRAHRHRLKAPQPRQKSHGCLQPGMQSFAHFEASLHHGIFRLFGNDLFASAFHNGAAIDNAEVKLAKLFNFCI
jgi:hypothetical protein